MPILEKKPQKMAAKTLSSEETVSNFCSPLSYPYSPTHMPLASKTVLSGICASACLTPSFPLSCA